MPPNPPPQYNIRNALILSEDPGAVEDARAALRGRMNVLWLEFDRSKFEDAAGARAPRRAYLAPPSRQRSHASDRTFAPITLPADATTPRCRRRWLPLAAAQARGSSRRGTTWTRTWWTGRSRS